MIEWVQANIQNILIAVGAAVVLFWSKIKEQLAVLQQQPQQPQQPQHCPCCCPDVPEETPEQKRSTWVVTTMELRQYCESRRLPEGVQLCDQLVGVIVRGRPKSASVTLTKEVEVR